MCFDGSVLSCASTGVAALEDNSCLIVYIVDVMHRQLQRLQTGLVLSVLLLQCIYSFCY